MPELPEVETIVRGLRGCLPGRRILRVTLTEQRILRTPAARMARALEGAVVLAVERYGKHILFRMARARAPFWFIVHLGMTGQLVCEPASREPRPHTHAWFELDGRGADGSGDLLRYSDMRQFGRLEIAAGAGDALPARLARLGPDPLAIEEGEFVRRLRARRARQGAAARPALPARPGQHLRRRKPVPRRPAPCGDR